MKRRVEFMIPGEPVSQGRPRFSNYGGFTKTYDPAKSRQGKQNVRVFAQQAVESHQLETPLEGPVMMMVQFGIAMPKSQARKRTPRPRVWRTKKPDLDNYVKLVKDGCSGIIYLDDNQIVRLTAEKIQCAQGEAPFTRVLFKELDELA